MGKILKGLYADCKRWPAWATLAYERNWMTHAAYLQVDLEPGPSIYDLLYSSPMFSIIKKAGAIQTVL